MKNIVVLGWALLIFGMNAIAQNGSGILNCGSYVMTQDAEVKDTFASINFCYYSASLPFQREVNGAILKYLDHSWGQEGMPSEIVMNADVFTKYVNDFVADYEEYATDYEEPNLWFLEMNIEVDETSLKEYVICSMSDYSYTGGAHGNANQNYKMFAKASGAELNLEAICTDVPMLTKRVDPYFRKAYDFPSDANFEEIGLNFENNRFHLAHNFWFDKTNLYFYFNQYEIGPYAAGTFEVAIPLTEVQDLFTIQFEK